MKYTKKTSFIQIKLYDYILDARKEIFHINIPDKYIQGKKALGPRNKRRR
ncbi:MAG: hypothetical protein ACTSWN_10510 [Promethearchaeota archaeon]